MLISVAVFLGSCMVVAQFSLRKVAALSRFGFKTFGCSCENTPMPSSLSAFEVGGGAVAIVGFGAAIVGMDSFFCFLGFWSCWLPAGTKLPTTT